MNISKVKHQGLTPCKLSLGVAIASLGFSAIASSAEQEIDEIVIVGESQLVESRITLQGDAIRVANTGEFLKVVPGANISRNGPLTGLPQYRGSNGDKVNVVVDGMPINASGPNAMDAPVSMVPGANLKSLTVSRGIASVSSGQETAGGHVNVQSQQGSFSDDSEIKTHLQANTLYNSNGDGTHSSALGFIANQNHKVGVSVSAQEGDDVDFQGNDEIPNTFFRRNRVNTFYGFQGDEFGFSLDAARINTKDTGTAALPMDIIFIDGKSVQGNAYLNINDWVVDFGAGSNRVEHGMDNFSHRQAPTMMMGMMMMPMNRFNFAEGAHKTASLELSGPLASGDISFGLDYSDSVYDSTISDPTNPAFSLSNFNNANRSILGLYAEWVRVSDSVSWELGLRQNQFEASADNASAAGAPMMVAMNLMPVIMAFNQADKTVEENNLDAVAKMAISLSDQADFSLGFARKTQAPSYQALYLWAPLQATGGLADGRNYIGNLELDSEVANEINVGLDYAVANTNLSFQVFYRDVEDYIQGTTEINSPFAAQINTVSNMMGGANALQFNNVDASFYGADLGYNGAIGDTVYYRGVLSYVRGQREDVNDDLYRIAPLNHTVTVGVNYETFDFSVTSELVAEQDKVASYNNEQVTAGYGLLHVNARWLASEKFQLVFGVDNLLDKNHAVHLNGYNRVANADIARGDRLKGPGRSVRVGLSYSF